MTYKVRNQSWRVGFSASALIPDHDYLPKTTRHSDTIDNVNVKIDNVMAKIQDKEEGRPLSRPTIPHWQDAQSPASWLHLRPVPHQRDPTTSLSLAREVSAPHNKSPPHTTSPATTGMWAQTRSASATTDARGSAIPHVAQVQQLAIMQAARSNKGLNAGLTGCAAITSPSSHALPHASSAGGTQAPSTTRTSLDLGTGAAS
jgi:hypothetical protein